MADSSTVRLERADLAHDSTTGDMGQRTHVAMREYTRASDLESPIARNDRRRPSSSNPAACRTDRDGSLSGSTQASIRANPPTPIAQPLASTAARRAKPRSRALGTTQYPKPTTPVWGRSIIDTSPTARSNSTAWIARLTPSLDSRRFRWRSMNARPASMVQIEGTVVPGGIEGSVPASRMQSRSSSDHGRSLSVSSLNIGSG